ncbi:unnamed protein product [Arabis nemorensis]|uniref:Endonuclease/exonuclease/phosphatase domain-containing protein n=1 Tax=Arabis nemorensis TaxID=586526 RepID=A0A565CVG3_9BRAS|nr:unnamed protein product [Arabis nemorensis]
MKVRMGSLNFFLSCVYGDPVRARRQAIWNQVEGLGMNRDEQWVLTGDFNELISNREKLGGAVRSESTFWGFRDMAQNCKIQEIRSCRNSFSWGGWRDDVWIQCRLDRSFGNDQWFQLFPRSNVEYMNLWASDHIEHVSRWKEKNQVEEDFTLIRD